MGFARIAGGLGKAARFIGKPISYAGRANKLLSGVSVGAPFRAAWATGGALAGLSRSIIRTGAWAGGGLAKAAYTHPMWTTAAGATALSLYGAGRGAYAASKSIQPPPLAYKRVPPVSGVGYNVWSSHSRGMSATNLSADGNLALSLHKVRHR
jgi:hypothetical protein